jgi:hypothetical protein
VILSWDSTSFDFWVNGTKILTRSSGMTLVITPKYLQLAGDYTRVYTTSGVEYDFAEFSNTRLDDTAAAAWTAWLQTRYGISP